MFKHIKRLFAVTFITALFVGLMGFQPASADGITAEFSATATATAEATASAKAVAYGNTDVTGKLLLADERVVIPKKTQKKLWKTPSIKVRAKYGTRVGSMEAAQTAVTKEVKQYKRLIAKTDLKQKKLKKKVKWAKKHHEAKKVKKLKKKVKKTKKRLAKILTSWQYRPLIGITIDQPETDCLYNEGRNGNLGVNHFRYCPGKDGVTILWIGYDPLNDLMRIVVYSHSTYDEPGCLNVPEFDIPRGAIEHEMVIMLRTLVGVELTVSVDIKVTVFLRITGVMKRNGEVCDQQIETATDTRTKTRSITVETSDTKDAMRMAENKVKANLDLMVQLEKEVSDEVTAEVSKTMTLKCDTEEPPVFIQFREMNDFEVNWKDDHCVTVDTPEGHSVTVYWEAKFGSFATPSKPAQDGVQACSDYKAPSEVPVGGTDTITVRAVDNVTGKSVTKTTDPFKIYDTAPHPG